jgi:cobalt-zinc-cadmium efflux system membrane fusion protein
MRHHRIRSETMSTTVRIAALALAALTWGLRAPAAPAPAGAEADAHAGHAHAAGQQADPHAGHAGEEKGVVTLSPQALKLAALEVQPAGGGTLARTLDGPGEIVLDEDRVAHLAPRAPGVVVKVLKTVGDTVAEGDVLAVLESAELGSAKIEYLTARVGREMARLDLDREQLVHDNTRKLLDLLKREPDPAEIARQTRGAAIGENRSRLVSAYAALRQARAAWSRAQALKQDRLVSDGDLDLAAKELESARAAYEGSVEDVELRQTQCLVQAQRTHTLAGNTALNAERRLHILGLTEAQVAALPSEEDAGIARLELRAPFAGTLIERHLTRGEHVSVETNGFTLADLSSVWCHVRVAPADAGRVRVGQAVRVLEAGRDAPRPGRVVMVSPLVNEKTRSGFVRVVLDNADRSLRPGQFVTGAIVLEEIRAAVAVPVAALQTFEGREIVFVQGDAEGEFVPRPVRRGFSDGRLVEIPAGLEPGEKVVVRNSFLLKAELGKGEGGHAH